MAVTSVLSNSTLWIWLNAIWLLTGLFYFRWSPETILFVYIFETSIIGFICVCKMLTLCFWGSRNKAEVQLAVSKNFSDREMNMLSRMNLDKLVYLLYNLFIIFMFAVVFLGFIWGQSIFTFLMASHSNPGIFDGPNKVLYNLSSLFSQQEMQAAFAGVAVTHIIIVLQRFVIPGNYKHVTLQQLFVQPWVRILIQQFLVIIGGFLFFKTGNNLVVVASLLVIIKTLFDIFVIDAKEKRAAMDVLSVQTDTATA